MQQRKEVKRMAMVIEIMVLLLLAVISTLTVFGVRKAAVVLLERV